MKKAVVNKKDKVKDVDRGRVDPEWEKEIDELEKFKKKLKKEIAEAKQKAKKK